MRHPTDVGEPATNLSKLHALKGRWALLERKVGLAVCTADESLMYKILVYILMFKLCVVSLECNTNIQV